MGGRLGTPADLDKLGGAEGAGRGPGEARDRVVAEIRPRPVPAPARGRTSETIARCDDRLDSEKERRA